MKINIMMRSIIKLINNPISIYYVILFPALEDVSSLKHNNSLHVVNNYTDALYFGITSQTTVGYGDIYPVTVAGKILSGVISMLGIGLVAVPTGIISAGFIEGAEQDNTEKIADKHFCPYCGKDIK